MYAYNCRQGQSTQGTYYLYQGSSLIDSLSFNDQLGYAYSYYPSLAAGSYTLFFKATWTPYDVRDYSVTIYAADTIPIYDNQGHTNNTVPVIRNLTAELLADINTALNSLSNYPYQDGGWQYTRKGYIDSETYFFQFGGQT